MSQLTDFQQLRKERSRRKLAKNLLILGIVAALVLGAFTLLRAMSQVNVGEQLSGMVDQISPGEGYPVFAYAGKVWDMEQAGENIVLLGENNFYRITQSGKILQNIAHNYFNPAMVCTGGRSLLYDRDGTGLRVDSRDKTLFQKSYEKPIVAADMNQEGVLAVATGSAKYRGEVVVYNKDFSEIYYWFSAENRILSLAVAPKDNLMAVGTVEAQEGELCSVISLFRFHSDKEAARVVLKDELLLSLDYKKQDNALCAVTTKGVYLIGSDGKISQSHSFGGETLWAYYNDGPGVTVALGDYKEQRRLEIYRLNDSLEATGPTVFNQRILDIKSSGSNTYVLADNRLYQYDAQMLLESTYTVPDAKAVQALNGRTYYTTGEQVLEAKSDQQPPK